jgi:hypothetical protein
MNPDLASCKAATLPQRDRSSDRNEQHYAALGHHPANAGCPRRALRSGTYVHLLIAGSPPMARVAVRNLR